MFKLNALIATVVLGASSVAMAQPGGSFHDSSRPVVVNPPTAQGFDWRSDQGSDQRVDRDRRRDRRDDDRQDRPRQYRASWVSLAEPMQLTRGRDRIDVAQRGTLTQLRIQTVAGASYIQRVIVRFKDGSRQVVEINRTVDLNNRMLQFTLDGNNRRVDSIAVIGRSPRNAAIQVFGI